MVDIAKLRDEITLERVKKQVEDGWTNPFMIAEHIVGRDVWQCLEDWDQKILMYNVHKMVTDNKIEGYF